MSTVDRYKIEITFFSDGVMTFHYGRLGTWGTDPFTDNDKCNTIEVVKTLEFTADGKGNYYNSSWLSSFTTEGTGTVEGEIWLVTMIIGMDIDTFKSIEEWRRL